MKVSPVNESPVYLLHTLEILITINSECFFC